MNIHYFFPSVKSFLTVFSIRHSIHQISKQSIEECMALMTNKRIRHLPVIEENKLVGLISIGDVVKAIISEQEFTIKQLENYITGGR